MALFHRTGEKENLGQCVEVRYPAAQCFFVLGLAMIAMFAYAMILLGRLKVTGFFSFFASTMVLLAAVLLSLLSMNLMNWRIQVYRDRLRARKWNMDEKELLFSDLTAVWDPGKLEELRAKQIKGKAEGKKKKTYCALVFGRDFIFLPLEFRNSLAAIQCVLRYCEGRKNEAAEALRSVIETSFSGDN